MSWHAVTALARPAPERRWAEASDLRWRVDLAHGLVALADASGPTYGGHHAPHGVAPGLDELARAWAAGEGDLVARLRGAFEAAHAVMAAIEARREPLAHGAASITAVAIVDGEIVVGQVGESRAYRVRAGAVELIALDHVLATQLAQHPARRAASPPPLADDGFTRQVVTRMLGLGDPEVDVVRVAGEVADGDAIVLCTRAVWQRDVAGALIAALAAADDEAALEAALAPCAEQIDAAAVVVSRRPRGPAPRPR